MTDRLVNSESHPGFPPRLHINNVQNPGFVLQETEKTGFFRNRSRTFRRPSARVAIQAFLR